MNWEPAHADHSIDRVTAILALQRLEPGDFDELVVAARKAGDAHQLTDRAEVFEPIALPPSPDQQIIRFDLNAGMAGSPPRRVTFRKLDADGKRFLTQLSVSFEQITVATTRYRRWTDFYALLKDLVLKMGDGSPAIARVKGIQLQYSDRFLSNVGGGDHFEVIKRDSEFVIPALRAKPDALHVHSGWFDFEGKTVRRLTNVNIDVADDSPPPPEGRRKITIMTLGRTDALEGDLDQPIERFEGLHEHLKQLYGNTITTVAAERVALND